MARGKTIVLLAGGALLFASSTAMAQRWGREHTPKDGACFYQDSDYDGDYFCVRSGDSVSVMPDGMNDRISSIRLFGQAQVVVYRDGRFRGRSERFDDSVRNLGHAGWNDQISSIEVRSSHDQGGRSADRHGSSDDRRSDDHRSSGRSQSDADRIVRRAYQDILDREPDSSGLRLYRSRIIDDDWSESQVRDALRNSPEYREKNTMTRAKAEDIVARAYRATLNRDPDAGSRGYVDKVLREHWTQQDVERELKKSAEYRNKHH
jgi:Peptidase inhibitor family I36